MAFIPTPAGVARIRSSWNLGASEAQNVLYCDTGLGHAMTAAEADQLLTLAVAAVDYDGGSGTTFRSNISSQITLATVHVEEGSDDDGAFATETPALVGGDAGLPVPPGVAVVTTWNTGLRGKSRRGRSYFAGLPDANIDADGRLDLTAQGAWEDGVNNLRAGFEAGGVAFPDIVGLVVASFYHQVVPGTPPTVARAVAQVTPITSGLVRSYAHSQRRRNPAG